MLYLISFAFCLAASAADELPVVPESIQLPVQPVPPTVLPQGQGDALSTFQLYNTRWYYASYPPYYKLGVFGISEYSPYYYHGLHRIRPGYYGYGGHYLGYKDSGVGVVDVTARNIFQQPIFVLTKSLESPTTFQLAYAPNGLQSVMSDPTLAYVKKYIQTPQPKSVVIFQPHQFFNARLYNAPISSVTLPQQFSVGDLAKISANRKNIPYLAFFDQAEFDQHHFRDIYDYGKFSVYPTFIEPVVDTHTSLPQ